MTSTVWPTRSAAPSRCLATSSAPAWVGCARQCASTTSTAGPACSWASCPASPRSPRGRWRPRHMPRSAPLCQALQSEAPAVSSPHSLGGRAMNTLRDIMRSGFLFTVQKKAMVSEAVRLMTDHNVGIVIVLDGSRLTGVFSERDVVRRVLHHGLDPARTPLGDVMTGYVITADAEMD